MYLRELLPEIWKLEFQRRVSSEEELKERLNIDDNVLKRLQDEGLLKGYRLTEKGRGQIKVVVCGGVFDILHPGHGFILDKSKEYGDVLVVIVARDSTVEKRKRIPIIPEEQRVEMVRHLKPVDVAILGREGGFLEIIEEIKPDIIVLGPDQSHERGQIRRELKEKGLDVEVVRIKEYKEYPLHSTRGILQKIIERGYPTKKSGH